MPYHLAVLLLHAWRVRRPVIEGVSYIDVRLSKCPTPIVFASATVPLRRHLPHCSVPAMYGLARPASLQEAYCSINHVAFATCAAMDGCRLSDHASGSIAVHIVICDL